MFIRKLKIDQNLLVGINMYVNLNGGTKILELISKMIFKKINCGKKGFTYVLDLIFKMNITIRFYQSVTFKSYLAYKQTCNSQRFKNDNINKLYEEQFMQQLQLTQKTHDSQQHSDLSTSKKKTKKKIYFKTHK